MAIKTITLGSQETATLGSQETAEEKLKKRRKAMQDRIKARQERTSAWEDASPEEQSKMMGAAMGTITGTGNPYAGTTAGSSGISSSNPDMVNLALALREGQKT
jgi:hypothetical protein